MLTPQEVSEHAFAKASFGGYNMAMVDEFLDELTDDYTALYKENAALRLYCDYDFASPRLTYDLKNSWADEDGNREVRSYSKRTPMHNFTFGASIAFMF